MDFQNTTRPIVLVIEDHSEIRENISELLEIYGLEIISASNGLDGVKIASERLPDLILCDIMMPDLDGYEVLTQLKNIPITNRIPVIFLTACTEKSEIARGLSLGADGYICKPFEESELIDTVINQLRIKA